MKNLKHILSGVDVSGLVEELASNPTLWNSIKYRTENSTSPHREVDDIWIRYNSLDNLTEDWNDFNKEHEAVWYPAYFSLPSLNKIISNLVTFVNGTQLGGILITRVPAGGKVYPHTDYNWHCKYYNKYAVQVLGNKNQSFCFKDESLSALPGDVYFFNNLNEHWVINDSQEDRITLIICIKNNIDELKEI